VSAGRFLRALGSCRATLPVVSFGDPGYCNGGDHLAELEGSGIECTVAGIAGIYSDPKHVILYTSNGEARQEFSMVLTDRAR
jgi:hypothetical protein